MAIVERLAPAGHREHLASPAKVGHQAYQDFLEPQGLAVRRAILVLAERLAIAASPEPRARPVLQGQADIVEPPVLAGLQELRDSRALVGLLDSPGPAEPLAHLAIPDSAVSPETAGLAEHQVNPDKVASAVTLAHQASQGPVEFPVIPARAEHLVEAAIAV